MSDTKEKFTQGGWAYSEGGGYPEYNHLIHMNGVIQFGFDSNTSMCDNPLKDGEAKANAHLISCAPEMYKMLDNIAIRMHETDQGSIQDILAIEYLLKKARGKL